MSYIITDDKHYKDIAKSLRLKMQTDREYYPKDMAIAIDNIPSSADGTDNPVIGIYYTNPDDNGNPTKVKISGWINPNGGFPSMFTIVMARNFIKEVEFLNCNFAILSNDMFKTCVSLTTVKLPDGLTSIGTNIFCDCSSLTTVNLPSTLTSIGQWAFQNCSLLTTVKLPDGLISIGYQTFFNCFSLTTVNLPSTLISIGQNIFLNCQSLKNVTLGDNFNCSNLNLSFSSQYARETILQWLNALADRTGQTAYILIIGAKNLAKLTEQDILIATNKNWTLA